MHNPRGLADGAFPSGIFMKGKNFLRDTKIFRVYHLGAAHSRLPVIDTPYRGIRGQGTVTLLQHRGRELLEQLLGRYLHGSDTPLHKMLLIADGDSRSRIRPIRIFAWDYTSRMKQSI